MQSSKHRSLLFIVSLGCLALIAICSLILVRGGTQKRDGRAAVGHVEGDERGQQKPQPSARIRPSWHKPGWRERQVERQRQEQQRRKEADEREQAGPAESKQRKVPSSPKTAEEQPPESGALEEQWFAPYIFDDLYAPPGDESAANSLFGASSAIDLRMMNVEVDPCDNFYSYACGSFSADLRNEGRDATFRSLLERNSLRLRDIVRAIVDSPFQRSSNLGRFYRSCVEHFSAPRDPPISEELASMVERIERRMGDGSWSVAAAWGALQQYDSVLPLKMSVEIRPADAPPKRDEDANRRRRLLMFLGRGSGLTADARDLGSDEHLERVRERFRRYFAHKRAGVAVESEALLHAKRTVACELSVAAAARHAQRVVREVPLVDYCRSERASYAEFLPYSRWNEALRQHSTERFDLIEFALAACPFDGDERCDDGGFWSDVVEGRAGVSGAFDMWVHPIEWFESMLHDLVASQPRESWRAYTMHAVLFEADNGAEMPRPYAYHKSYDAMYGLPWMKPDRSAAVRGPPDDAEAIERRCLANSESYLPLIVDRYFDESVLSPDARALVLSVVESVKATYADELRRSEVLAGYASAEEVERLARKIERVHVQVGSPTRSRYYFRSDGGAERNVEPLELDDRDYVANLLRIRHFHAREDYLRLLEQFPNKLGSASAPGAGSGTIGVDDLYDQLDSVANAFYQHQFNTITLNAGVLEAPVFDEHFDAVSIYSRLAVFVAHELSHALDPMGMDFDDAGLVSSGARRMSERFSDGYAQRSRCFRQLYTRKTALGNMHDGAQTLNENIADVSGFRVAYRAFLSTFSETLREKAAHTGRDEMRSLMDALARKFFLSYAQLFCKGRTSVAEERQEVAAYRHSLPEFRVDAVVKQHQDFWHAWSCDDAAHTIESVGRRVYDWAGLFERLDKDGRNSLDSAQRCQIF